MRSSSHTSADCRRANGVRARGRRVRLIALLVAALTLPCAAVETPREVRVQARNALAAAGRRFVREQYAWPAVEARLVKALQR